MKIVGVGVMVGVAVAHAPQSDGQVEQDSPPEHDPLGQVTQAPQSDGQVEHVSPPEQEPFGQVEHAPQSDGQVEQDSPPEHDPLGQVTGGGVGAGVDVGAF